jgi:hypothetical protein
MVSSLSDFRHFQLSLAMISPSSLSSRAHVTELPRRRAAHVVYGFFVSAANICGFTMPSFLAMSPSPDAGHAEVYAYRPSASFVLVFRQFSPRAAMFTQVSRLPPADGCHFQASDAVAATSYAPFACLWLSPPRFHYYLSLKKNTLPDSRRPVLPRVSFHCSQFRLRIRFSLRFRSPIRRFHYVASPF